MTEEKFEVAKMQAGQEQLTEDELKTLVNIVSQVNVPVAQAPQFIDLINKMTRIIDAMRIQPRAFPKQGEQ